MNKILAIAILATVSATASANGFRGGHHGHHGHGGYYGRGGYPSYSWVAPVIIGGAVVYGITHRDNYPPAVVQPPPVIIYQQPISNQSNCSAWVETQQPDGLIVRQRTCSQ